MYCQQNRINHNSLNFKVQEMINIEFSDFSVFQNYYLSKKETQL